MSPIEIAATIFGLISVYLTVKEHIWCWPTGIIMVALYAYVFYNAKLYPDTGLQIFYFFIQFYGWYNWKYGGNKKDQLHITTLTRKQIISWSIIGIICTISMGYYMNTYTDAHSAYADSFITVVSVIGQWFLTKKYLENWHLWIAVDVVAVVTYSINKLYLTGGLYLVFLGLAIAGLVEWQKSLKKQAKHVG